MSRRVWDELLVHHKKLYILFDPDTDAVFSVHTSFNNAMLNRRRLLNGKIKVDISSVSKRELETFYEDDKVVVDYLRRHSLNIREQPRPSFGSGAGRYVDARFNWKPVAYTRYSGTALTILEIYRLSNFDDYGTTKGE